MSRDALALRANPKYLISFPSEAMVLAPGELPEVAAGARALSAEAEKAGIYVVARGVEKSDEPVRGWEDGSVPTEIYPDSRIPTRQEAVERARRTLTAAVGAGRSAHAPRQS